MSKARSSRRLGLLSIAVSGAMLATTSTAVAKDEVAEPGTTENDAETVDLEPVPHDQVTGPFKIDDGKYTVALAYTYVQTMGREGLTLLLHRAGSGTGGFVVAEEAMTGEWTLNDSGGLTIPEHPGLAEADAVGNASGTFSGSFPYTFAGTYVSDVNATVSAAAVGGPNISATDSDSGSVELSFELSESVQICGQVQANWDQSYRDLMSELGWEIKVKTQLVAFPEAGEDEIQSRIAALVESATQATGAIGGDELIIEFMIDSLVEAESIMSDIEGYPQTCPLDAGFLRIVNQVLRDMMNTLLNQWESQDEGVAMILLRRMVEVGLRAGVLGSGSADPLAAEFLEEKVLSLVQDRFDELVDTTFDVDELRQTIIIAEMLDHQLAEASNADLCLVLEGC